MNWLAIYIEDLLPVLAMGKVQLDKRIYAHILPQPWQWREGGVCGLYLTESFSLLAIGMYSFILRTPVFIHETNYSLVMFGEQLSLLGLEESMLALRAE